MADGEALRAVIGARSEHHERKGRLPCAMPHRATCHSKSAFQGSCFPLSCVPPVPNRCTVTLAKSSASGLSCARRSDMTAPVLKHSGIVSGGSVDNARVRRRTPDERADLPVDRARGRRGHPHALRRPRCCTRSRGRSLLAHVLAPLREAQAQRGGGRGRARTMTRSRRRCSASLPDAETFVQTERRGTAHAVLAANAAIARGADDILVVFGDTPLIRPETLRAPARGLGRGRGRRGARASGRPIRPATAGW